MLCSSRTKRSFALSLKKLINSGNLDAADQYFAQDFVDHTAPAGQPKGLAGFKAYITTLRGAFPDLHFTVEDVVAEGEKVVVRITARGTMTDSSRR